LKHRGVEQLFISQKRNNII